MSRFFVVGKYGGDGGGEARCNMNGFKFNLSTYLIYQTALVEIHQYIVYTQKYCIVLNLRYASVLINPTTRDVYTNNS